MAASRSTNNRKSEKSTTALTIRIDSASMRILVEAAKLRKISVADFIRTYAVTQANREVHAAHDNAISAISLTPDEQRAFWNALNKPCKLTPAQKRLSDLMRGEPSA